MKNLTKISKIIISISKTIIMTCLLWIAITLMIQAFKCSELTAIQLILNVPQQVKLNFENCE